MNARKLQAVPALKPATTAEVEAELTAARQALAAAATAVDAAKAALDSAPRDASKRAELREAIHMATEDHEAAQATVESIEKRLGAAQCRDDERALAAAVERIGIVAQMNAATVDADEFVTVIGKAIEAFFERMRVRNLALRDEANQINSIWMRLGHTHRCQGMATEAGTGTEAIPARVSLEALHNWQTFARRKLEYLAPGASEVQQATRALLLGALDYATTLHHLKQSVAHNHNLRASHGKAVTK